jgi:membrane protease YdiL (CAAX protease family)
MSQRRSIIWFLAITFVISWPLFLLPLAFGGADAAMRQMVALVGWSLAMFAPAIAALITVRWIAGESLSVLKLRQLGPKRFYLWAWLLPPLLAVAALLFTLLLGFGQLDPTFALIRGAIPPQAGDAALPVWVVVAGQIVAAFTIAPLINTIPAMGEELGWRGFLLPRLMHLGKWRAIGLSNVIWGFWHAPAILQGHNYPENPVLGVILMIGFCLLVGTIFSWLYLETDSAWAPALAHGSLNATAALPMLFLAPGTNITFGGTLASLAGWIGLALFVAWLVATRRL